MRTPERSSRFHPALRPIFPLLLFLLPLAEPVSGMLPAAPDTSLVRPSGPAGWQSERPEKARLLPGRFKKTARSLPVVENEKPGKRARLALLFFVCSFAGGYLGAVSIVFSFLFLAAFLTSTVLSIIVLARESNPKSRKLARLILIIQGIAIVATLLLVALLLHFFPNNPR